MAVFKWNLYVGRNEIGASSKPENISPSFLPFVNSSYFDSISGISPSLRFLSASCKSISCWTTSASAPISFVVRKFKSPMKIAWSWGFKKSNPSSNFMALIIVVTSSTLLRYCNSPSLAARCAVANVSSVRPSESVYPISIPTPPFNEERAMPQPASATEQEVIFSANGVITTSPIAPT